VRLALGGVAHKSWRASADEQVLLGATANEDVFKTAAAEELQAARGYAL
jgi:xanthine dehydrogenase YagS FAD-binding subunit